MFDSIYIGLSGMLTFSKNLTVIGNNVSNLNTTAFKGSQLSFTDLLYSHQLSDANNGTGSSMEFGSGVGSGSTRVLFTQGTLKQTGNSTDLAIQGNGFFVLRDPNQNSIYAANGRDTYTRDGEFDFDKDGFLISKQTGGRVQAFDGAGLQDINVSSLRTSPPQATANVHFTGNLDTGGTTADATFTAFDASGTAHTLKVHFTKVSTGSPPEWQYAVQDESGANIANGDIQFNADGSPATGNTQTFAFTPIGGASPTSITLDFGAAGGFSGVTSFSGATSIAGSADGFAVGALTDATFNEDGVLTITYSNGQTRTGPTLALAFFSAPEDLDVIAGGIYDNRSGQKVTLGAPRSSVFGSVEAKSLETANVDVTQQFSDLIVTQRGYQASSQVISTANDMIQELLAMSGGKQS